MILFIYGFGVYEKPKSGSRYVMFGSRKDRKETKYIIVFAPLRVLLCISV